MNNPTPSNNPLRTIFESDSLAWLVDRLVRKLQKGDDLSKGSLTLQNASATQRVTIDNLLGRRATSGPNLTVSLPLLCESLNLDNESLCNLIATIRDSEMRGNRQKARHEIEWQFLFQQWESEFQDQPALLSTLAELRAKGLLKRLSGNDLAKARQLLSYLQAIFSQVPYNNQTLAAVATLHTGDSHALDRSKPLGTLSLRALKHLTHIDGALSGSSRRRAWQSIGIGVDDLSAPLLCLNLRAHSDCPAAPWIDWHCQQGEPFYLNWRQLSSFKPSEEMPIAYVCENPAVVSEAANQLGVRSQPLICLNGMPTSSAHHLLDSLENASIAVHLRADFDWAGLHIVNQIHKPGLTTLWRMDAADYQNGKGSQPLTTPPASTPDWASQLAPAMQKRGLAVYEEDLVAILLQDLERGEDPR